jgi:hypothetical protein
MPTLPVYDRAQLDRIISAQLGIVTRSQVLACGLSRSSIDYRLRPAGPWSQLLTGVYLTMSGAPTDVQRGMAALLYGGPLSMITGAAAVQALGLKCDRSLVIEILVPASCERKSMGFVKVQRTTRLPEKPVRAGWLRYAPLPRAIADAARSMKRFGDVQALVCQGVQRGRCTPEDLAQEISDGPMQGSRLFREAVGELGAGIWSAPEGDLKRLIDRSDLEKPVYNPMLYAADGSFLGCPDAWWERAGVAAEVDSRQYHMEAQGYEKTVTKHNRMTVAGITVLHWLPSTIRKQSETVISDLRAALTEGNRRPKLPITTVTRSDRSG